MFPRHIIEGSATWKHISKDGIVLAEGKVNNHFVRHTRKMNFNSADSLRDNPLGQYTLGSDDPRPIAKMHPEYDNLLKALDEISGWQNQETVLPDPNTLVRTVNHTMTNSGTGPCDLSWVGMNIGNNSTPPQHIQSFTTIMTVMPIDPAVTVQVGETFQLTYQVTPIAPTRKQFMKRFGINYRCARAWHAAHVSDQNAGTDLTYASRLSPLTLTLKDWFLDPDCWYTSFGEVGYTSENNNIVRAGINATRSRNAARFGVIEVEEALGQAAGDLNSQWIGAVGMVIDTSGNNRVWQPGNNNVAVDTEWDFVEWAAQGIWPFAWLEGEVTRTFSHSQGRTFQFEEASFEADGLGAVESRGVYTPPVEVGAPAHWLVQMIVTDSGDTDGGTEAKYIFRRKLWVSRARMPAVDLTNNPDSGVVHSSDSRWLSTERSSGETANTNRSAMQVGGSSDDIIVSTLDNWNTDYRGNYMSVWDGVDSIWGLQDRNSGGIISFSPGHGLSKVRLLTPEAPVHHILVDDRRFVNELGQIIGQSNNSPFGLASDEAGRVFFGHRNTNEAAADNEINVIDVRKQARWIQRPSGFADGVTTDRFNVSVDDEYHGMYPFDGATDVGRLLRIVSSPFGNNGIHEVGAVVDDNNVDLVVPGTATPVVLAAEQDITWHWITAATTPTDHSVGELYSMVYDKNFGRLWVYGSLGIQFTTDYGQTWSTLFNESTVGGEVPPNSDHRLVFGAFSTSRSGQIMVVDGEGSLYWVQDGGTQATSFLNKLTVNNGIGVDQEYSRLSLTAFSGNLRVLQASDLVSGSDTDDFTINDGVNTATNFRYDDDSSVVESTFVRAINHTGVETAEQIRDATVSAINAAPQLNITATPGPGAIVFLHNNAGGPSAAVTITESVGNTGFLRGVKPVEINSIFWESGVDNPSAVEDGSSPGGVRPLGALWIMDTDLGSNCDSYRMILKSGPLDAANITAYNSAALPTIGGEYNSADNLMAPVNFDGDTILGADSTNKGEHHIFQPALGLFINVTQSGEYYERRAPDMRPVDGVMIKWKERNADRLTAAAGTIPYTYRYLASEDEWIPYSGDSAQFDALYNVARGTITVVQASQLVAAADTDDFTIDDGVNTPTQFIYDDDSSVVESTFVRAINHTGSETARQMRDATLAAINAAPQLDVTAEVGGSDIVRLRNDTAGTAGNAAIVNSVADGGFSVTGMSGGNVADGGKRDAHTTWEKLIDGSEVRWLEIGDATPANEFVAGDSHSFAMAYGLARTNVNDWQSTRYLPQGTTEVYVEDEPIKTAKLPPYDVAHKQQYNDDINEPLSNPTPPPTYLPPEIIANELDEWMDPVLPGNGYGVLGGVTQPVGGVPMSHQVITGQGDFPDSAPILTYANRGTAWTVIDLNAPAEGVIDCDAGGTGVLPTDNQTLVIHGTTFEFNRTGVGVGGIELDIQAASTDDDVRDVIIAAVNANVTGLGAYNGGPGKVFMRFLLGDRGAAGNGAITGTAVTGNFTTTGLAGGADAPEIHKIRWKFWARPVTLNPNETQHSRAFSFDNVGGSSDYLGLLRINSAPDWDVTSFTEASATLRWPGSDEPGVGADPGATRWYDLHFLCSHQHSSDANAAPADGSWQVVADLAAAGLSAGARTRRAWMMVFDQRRNTPDNPAGSARNDTGPIHLTAIEVLDADDNIIGFTDNDRLINANIDDFATWGVNIDEAFWIDQDSDGLTTISTADDGDGDGVTDLVTIDAGAFDTSLIDITKDYFAWDEPSNPATNGFLRSGRLSSDAPAPALRSQAMARIIGIEGGGTQLRLAADIVPDNLTNVDWEVRRPCNLTTEDTGMDNTDPDNLCYVKSSGYFYHTWENAKLRRRFRVTRYSRTLMER